MDRIDRDILKTGGGNHRGFEIMGQSLFTEVRFCIGGVLNTSKNLSTHTQLGWVKRGRGRLAPSQAFMSVIAWA